MVYTHQDPLRDFGDLYPNCEVRGTDVSPIQPTWVPPNVFLYVRSSSLTHDLSATLESQLTRPSDIEDCLQPWTFDPNTFDYVHIRYMVGSIGDWTELFRQAFAACKPGGYLETYEGSAVLDSDDGTLGEYMAQWGNFFVEGGKKIGKPFTVLADGTQRKAMEEAGFVDIEEWNFKVRTQVKLLSASSHYLLTSARFLWADGLRIRR